MSDKLCIKLLSATKRKKVVNENDVIELEVVVIVFSLPVL